MDNIPMYTPKFDDVAGKDEVVWYGQLYCLSAEESASHTHFVSLEINMKSYHRVLKGSYDK